MTCIEILLYTFGFIGGMCTMGILWVLHDALTEKEV